jgi:CheY-like chemotaxis protein
MVDARGTQTVLVVDDEKVVRDFWALTLKSAGYNVLLRTDSWRCNVQVLASPC